MNLIIGIAITVIFYIVAADAIKKHPEFEIVTMRGLGYKVVKK